MSIYNIGTFVVKAIFKLCFRIKINGIENLPPDNEKFLVCSNHKSNLDPPMIGITVPYQLGFMAKEELFKFKPFGALIRNLGAFPIKRGKSDFGALRSAIDFAKKFRHCIYTVYISR